MMEGRSGRVTSTGTRALATSGRRGFRRWSPLQRWNRGTPALPVLLGLSREMELVRASRVPVPSPLPRAEHATLVRAWVLDGRPGAERAGFAMGAEEPLLG